VSHENELLICITPQQALFLSSVELSRSLGSFGASTQSCTQSYCSTQRQGLCDGLKPISERCNTSFLFAAEGEYSAADQITSHSNSFVWLASIQACEPCPAQSVAIVMLRMLHQLCDKLQCYVDFLPPISFKLFIAFLFLRSSNPLLHYDSLLPLCQSSFPHFLYPFLSPRVPCAITPCPPLRCIFMSLS